MSMTRTVADKAMTDAQMLRHLRRHPHRRDVVMLLLAVAAESVFRGVAASAWSADLTNISRAIIE